MNVIINKWGNSLAVRIPSSIARSVRLSEGDALAIMDEGDKIILKTVKKRACDLEDMLSKVTAKNLHGEIATERAGREEW